MHDDDETTPENEELAEVIALPISADAPEGDAERRTADTTVDWDSYPLN